MVSFNRGDIFLANLEPIEGKEQGGIRPVLLIQNTISNKNSPVIIVAAITSKVFSKEFPTNVTLSKENSGLPKDSVIMLNQIRTIDKRRIIRKLGTLTHEIMDRVNFALRISLGLD